MLNKIKKERTFWKPICNRPSIHHHHQQESNLGNYSDRRSGFSFVWFCCLIGEYKNEWFSRELAITNNGKSATFALRKAIEWRGKKERKMWCLFMRFYKAIYLSLSLSVTTFFSDKLWYSYVYVYVHIYIFFVMDNIMVIGMHVYIICVCIQNRGWVVGQVILIQTDLL